MGVTKRARSTLGVDVGVELSIIDGKKIVAIEFGDAPEDLVDFDIDEAFILLQQLADVIGTQITIGASSLEAS